MTQFTKYQWTFSRAGILLLAIGIFLWWIAYFKGIQILLFIPAFVGSIFLYALREYFTIGKNISFEKKFVWWKYFIHLYQNKSKKYNFLLLEKTSDWQNFLIPNTQLQYSVSQNSKNELYLYVFWRFDIIRKKYFLWTAQKIIIDEKDLQFELSEKLKEWEVIEKIDPLRSSMSDIPYLKKSYYSLFQNLQDWDISVVSNKPLEKKYQTHVFFLHILLILLSTVWFIIEWRDFYLSSVLFLTLLWGILYGKKRNITEWTNKILMIILFVLMLIHTYFYKDMSGPGSVFLLQLLVITSLTKTWKKQSFLFIFLTLFVFVAISLFSSQIRFIFLFLIYLAVSTYLLFFISWNETYDQNNYKFWTQLHFKDIFQTISIIIVWVFILYFILPHWVKNNTQITPPLQQNTEVATGFSEGFSFENIWSIYEDNSKIFVIENISEQEIEKYKFYYFRWARYHYFDGIKWENTSSQNWLLFLNKNTPNEFEVTKRFHYYIENSRNIFLPAGVTQITTPSQNWFFHPYWDSTILKTQQIVPQSITANLTFETDENGNILSYEKFNKDFEIKINEDQQTLLKNFIQNIPTNVQTLKDYENYIRFRAGFAYSTDMIAKNFEDFLYGSKTWHCEYYATTLALVLQNAWYKATVVSGFLEWEYNNLAQSLVVRGKNAHAWVEVYDEENDSWIILDPTPPNFNFDIIEFSQVAFSIVREYYDFIDIKWFTYFVNFTWDEQKALFGWLYKNIFQILWWIFLLIILIFWIKKISWIWKFFKKSKKEKIMFFWSLFFQKSEKFIIQELKNSDQILWKKYENFIYSSKNNISWSEFFKDFYKNKNIIIDKYKNKLQ